MLKARHSMNLTMILEYRAKEDKAVSTGLKIHRRMLSCQSQKIVSKSWETSEL